MDGWLYAPDGAATATVNIVGCVLLAPGSSGGLGPGLTKCPQPFGEAAGKLGHGGMYMRLGKELAAGLECEGWEAAYNSTAASSKRAPSAGARPRGVDRARGAGAGRKAKGAGQAGAAAGWRMPVAGDCCVTLQIDWTTIPFKRLRRLDMLESSVADVTVAAHWLLARYPGVPLVVAGFSFGGPSIWPALGSLPADAPIAGAASIAGSARGGPKFAKRNLATADAVRRFCARQIIPSPGAEPCPPAVLFLHGTHDANVALQVAEHLHDAAAHPKCLVQVNYALHMFDTARDATHQALRDWVVGTLQRWHHRRGADAAAAEGAPQCRYVQDARVVIGRQMKLRAGDKAGRESWRPKPSPGRLARIKCSKGHPLAGLMGYSE